MAKLIEFDTGLKEYDIKGYKLWVNPTDEGFAAKLEDAFKSLDGLQDKLAEDDSLSKFAELDADMRGKLDGLLGAGAADAIFPGMNCYAIADGLPVWMNLVLALLYEVTEAYEAEFGKTDARVKAHKAKYDAMLRKYRRK